jgi:iron complex transport system substrate-binding protein
VRIASVLPSATEIVAALGAEEELVARSAECDYPASVRRLPVLMRPRTLDQDRPSVEIDRRVRASRALGESLYTIDTDVLGRVRPEVLLTQDLCGVCSVTGDEVAEACATAGIAPTIVSLSPTDLEGVVGSIETVGRAIGREGVATRLAHELRVRIAPSSVRPVRRVAVVEWLDPPILAGLWTPEIVHRAGGVYVGPAVGAPGDRTSWESLAALRPDLVVLSPCSFSVDRTIRELGAGPLREEIGRTLPRTPLVVADEAYFSRPGPRLALGVELVRALVRSPVPPADSPLPAVSWSPAAGEAAA